mmetsp:Transcript_11502/g.17344  ORF Transcript_11502/g.17344 Transcript_11502/m.17344 type:complete len:149 (+) Transcript_11502:18-464(+)
MHPDTLYFYNAEIKFERSHLAFYIWGRPSVITIRGCQSERMGKQEVVKILKSDVMKEWLEDWVTSDGSALRREEIMRIKLRTSLPRNLDQIPDSPSTCDNRSSCRIQSDQKDATGHPNKTKRSRYTRKKALQKEVNWRNEMTMRVIEM